MKRLLFTEKNARGFVPYSHAYAGFGQEPTNSDRIDPANLAVGILDSVIADMRAQAQAVSGRHNALMDATFNPIGTRMGADELRDQLDQGDIIEMSDREMSGEWTYPSYHGGCSRQRNGCREI